MPHKLVLVPTHHAFMVGLIGGGQDEYHITYELPDGTLKSTDCPFEVDDPMTYIWTKVIFMDPMVKIYAKIPI